MVLERIFPLCSQGLKREHAIEVIKFKVYHTENQVFVFLNKKDVRFAVDHS